ncbi:AraC family transcriptional regulator [Alteromonas lipolytica]|uniref:HTH araC/xylS-type domain-containing protein n=1 Tax=Alteromonas lipolytica TaxID=1856405 RepID=A0A1E8FD62_9ALTE|nr:AraC family transcriptional regulator [Alteromonas lipolytica]OFI33518.1 hypothetical protein BFC17_04475 [Alteromonas lipolytica]GGF58961.1 AraC family transcriptional regulator [Alteromonas lipolytica]
MTDIPKPKRGTVANHYVTAIYNTAQRQGLNAEKLLIDNGFSLTDINQPDLRLDIENLAAFQRSVWAALSDESMGHLHVTLPAGTYYLMARLAVAQPTLHEALLWGIRFYNIVTRFEFVRLEREEQNSVLVINLPQPERDYQHLFGEISLLAWHRLASWLIADTLPLCESRFDYSEPAHVAEYAYLYPGKHRFNHRQLAIVFPSSYLSRPVRQNDATLVSFMNRCPLVLFHRYITDFSTSSEVKQLLEAYTFDDGFTITDCARQVHLTTKTLMRRLKEEGTSFQQLKDIVRRDKAVHLLLRSDLSVYDIAEQVGYSDTAVFSRAFKKWTGEPPKRYRDKHRSAT